ncbi:hypothetical protein V8C86DRAFT_2649158, partial [Haematococcus lacustris]
MGLKPRKASLGLMVSRVLGVLQAVTAAEIGPTLYRQAHMQKPVKSVPLLYAINHGAARSPCLPHRVCHLLHPTPWFQLNMHLNSNSGV